MKTSTVLSSLAKIVRSQFTVLVVLGGLFATGCQTSAFDVSLNITEQRQTGGAAGTISTFLPTPYVVIVNLADEAKIRGINPPKKAYIKDLSFAITSTARPVGDIDTFDYLNTVEFFLEPTRVGSQLQKLKVADIPSKEGPAGEISPRLTSNLDILPLLNEGARMVATATGNLPPDDVSYNGQIVIGVDVF